MREPVAGDVGVMRSLLGREVQVVRSRAGHYVKALAYSQKPVGLGIWGNRRLARDRNLSCQCCERRNDSRVAAGLWCATSMG